MSIPAYPGILKLGSHGAAVKTLQRALPVQETGEFGPTTELIVKRFQGLNGLEVDGVVGPLTWAALFPAESFRSTVITLAKSYIGVKEEPMGSNRGRQVSAWQRLLGFDGQPWCAAFTYGVCHEAAAKTKIKNPLPVDGYCPTILKWAKATGRIVAQPQPGDIFLLKDPTYGAKHIGFVLRDNGDSTVSTIEGNTSDQVRALTRAKNTVVFVSISKEVMSSSTVAPIDTQQTGDDKIV